MPYTWFQSVSEYESESEFYDQLDSSHETSVNGCFLGSGDLLCSESSEAAIDTIRDYPYSDD